MKLSWDEAKRQATRVERGLDFASAGELFDGLHFTEEDARKDYGEAATFRQGMFPAGFASLCGRRVTASDILFR